MTVRPPQAEGKAAGTSASGKTASTRGSSRRRTPRCRDIDRLRIAAILLLYEAAVGRWDPVRFLFDMTPMKKPVAASAARPATAKGTPPAAPGA